MIGSKQEDKNRTEITLKDSELRYRRLFETAQDGILILDAETGAITDVNPFLINMLGYTREEFVEKKLWEVGAFKDIEASQEAFEALQKNEYIRYEDLPLKSKDGRLIQVEFVSNVYLVGDQKVIQCNIRDITAHKQSEQALHKSEERYRSTLGSMMEGCQIIGYDWRYLFVNDSVVSQGKLKKEEMLGHTMMECYPGIEKTDMFAVLRHCMDERTPHLKENEFIFPDSSKGWFELSIQPIPEGVFILSIDITERKRANLKLEAQNKELLFQNEEKEKRTAELSIVVQNLKRNEEGLQAEVTERKRAEETLQKSEKRFRALVEHSLEEISLVDSNGTLTYESPTSLRPLGYPPNSFVGHNLFDLFHPDERAAAAQLLKQVIKHPGSVQEALFRLRHQDGSWRWMEGFLTNLLNDPAVQSVVINYRDITDRKLAEQELANLAKFPSENPNPVLRLSRDGIVMYANTASSTLLGMWGCVVGGTAPKFWCDLAAQALATKENKIVDIECDGKVYAMFVTPIPESDYVNLYARDVTERKQAEEQIRRQLEHLTALSGIDRVITANYDLDLSLSEIIKHVMMELGVDAAAIFLFNPYLQILEFGAESGFRSKAIRKAQIRLGEGFAGHVAQERRLVQMPNLQEDPLFRTPLLVDEDFVCGYGVPLIIKGQVKGVLEVFQRAALKPDSEWLDFLNILAGQTAIAIEIATLFESLQRSNLELSKAYDATIEGWSHALDLRDKETEGHTQRVTEMTVKLGRAFGLSEAELVQVRWGALLHDIGKMGVPDAILLKPEPLTDEEWVKMKKHPTFAYELLSPIYYLRLALDIPYCHHEKWDGTGYPRGLKDTQIPLVARIFAVVDVWDALSSDRPYRPAWTKEKAREFIRNSSGTHFDPKVVDMFMRIPDLF